LYKLWIQKKKPYSVEAKDIIKLDVEPIKKNGKST